MRRPTPHAALLVACLLLAIACQRDSARTAAVDSAAPEVDAGESWSADELTRRAMRRHAVDAVIWGVPAVNYELLHEGLVSVGGASNQIVYWSRLPDWKNQTLTPNPDVIYLMAFYDTREGPVVLEIPAAGRGSITGSVDDGWQTAVEDVGPAGVDKGKGGRYLILPPGHEGRVPAGYLPMPSPTYVGYALLRSNIGSGSDADIAAAVEYGRTVRLHPLSRAADPPATTFVDASEKVYDSTLPFDLRFYERLHRFVDREPWLERDRVMIEKLESIGIEKGKPFAPDQQTQAILREAIAEARAFLEATYEAAFANRYFPDSRWAVPVDPKVLEGLASNYAETASYPVLGRGVMYTFGFFSAKHLGHGQFYLLGIHDKDGKPLDGARTYRLTVPPDAPVSLYWSATAYDRATHALIRDQSRSSRASTSQGLQKNADGSIDVWFGPQAPQGKDANWVPTRAGGRFEVLFRLYGPQQPLFDKTWRLPDIEEVR